MVRGGMRHDLVVAQLVEASRLKTCKSSPTKATETASLASNVPEHIGPRASAALSSCALRVSLSSCALPLLTLLEHAVQGTHTHCLRTLMDHARRSVHTVFRREVKHAVGLDRPSDPTLQRVELRLGEVQVRRDAPVAEEKVG